MYLVEKIINKCEGSSNDWRQGASGGRSLKIEQEDYDSCGKSELIREAAELEALGFIRIKWLIRGSDIEKVFYRLENMSRFYDLLNEHLVKKRVPKYQVLKEYQERIEQELEVLHSEWIRNYYRDMLLKLENGKFPTC